MDSAQKNTIETTKKVLFLKNAYHKFSEGFLPNSVLTIVPYLVVWPEPER